MSFTWRTAVATIFLGTIAAVASAADWPQFRGPKGDGQCTETGLLQEWPKEGPQLLWKMSGLGKGYSSVAVVKDRLYTLGDRGPDAYLLAIDLKDQKELWATKIGQGWGDGGPRCTPTIDGDRIYALTPQGDLVCAALADGKIAWRKNMGQDFGGQMMSGWGYSESPMIDGDKLICTPGGGDALMVALNKSTGETLWKCPMPEIGPRGKNGAGYSSVIIAEIGGTRQYIQNTGRGIVGVAAQDGKFLWSYNRVACSVANITSPIVKDNLVFATNSYKTGCALLEIVANDGRFEAKEKYFLGPKDFENHHGGVVLIGKYLYGGDGQNTGAPTCLDFLTGKIVWKEKALSGGSAAVLYADNRLYFRYDTGTMALIEVTPERMNVKGQFKLPVNDGPGWAYPVIADGKLYLRSHDTLMCYDVKGK